MPAILVTLFKGVIFNLLKEAFLSIVGKIPWKHVIERFYTRMLKRYLTKISKLDSNSWKYDMAVSMLDGMEKNGLRVAVKDIEE